MRIAGDGVNVALQRSFRWKCDYIKDNLSAPLCFHVVMARLTEEVS